MYRQHIPTESGRLPSATGWRRLFSFLSLWKKSYRRWWIRKNHSQNEHDIYGFNGRPFFRQFSRARGLNRHCRICKVFFPISPERAEISNLPDLETECTECWDEHICRFCHKKKFGVEL